MTLKLFFIASFLVALSVALDPYCDLKKFNCKDPHIGCNSTKKFNPTACAKWPQVQLVPLNLAEKNKILDEHNKARNATAFGQAVNGKTAARLCKMKWNDNLALTACFNVWNCFDNHDKCRNTLEYKSVGQNLYNTYNTKEVPVMDTIEKCVKKWYDESKFCTQGHIGKLPRGIDAIGHFTQIVWHNACFVGCCAAKWKIGEKTYQYWVCNYSNGNAFDKQIFDEGKTASGCKTGADKKFNGLCSSREKFDLPILLASSRSMEKGVRKVKRRERKFHFQRNEE